MLGLGIQVPALNHAISRCVRCPIGMCWEFWQHSSNTCSSHLHCQGAQQTRARHSGHNAVTRMTGLRLPQPLLLCPQSTQQLVAAAAAAAASAAASAALNKQPWDTLELQMEVVETTSRSRYFVIGERDLWLHLLRVVGLICRRALAAVSKAVSGGVQRPCSPQTRPCSPQGNAVLHESSVSHSIPPTLLPTCLLCGAFHAVCAATLLLAVQLLLCFAVATLWAHTEEEDEEAQEGEGDALCYKVITDCDLKKHKQQQQQGEWASMAEEGRGLYEKLLSYT